MFVQGYGIGFPRDTRVASHQNPNTQSSVSLWALPVPKESFKLPHLGGKLTEMTYLWTVKHNGRQELRYSPPLHFSVSHTQYCIFWKFLGQKFFLSHFELYWTELEFWILTPKNEKYFLVPTPDHYYAAWPLHISIFSHNRGESATSLIN